MSEVLLVSKAVEPPWNDSSKNLVRDLAGAMARHQPVVLTSSNQKNQRFGRARLEGIYGATKAGFAPQVSSQIPVLKRLLLDRTADVFHFFFAPNPRTSTVARLVSAARRRRSVQTVCSAPSEGADLHRILFADRTVVLSEHTLQRFLRAGISEERLTLIPPCIPPLAPRSDAEREATRTRHGLPLGAPLLVYPGDLEFSRGADRSVSMLANLRREGDPVLAICARAKTAEAERRRLALRERVEREGLSERVRFLGELSDIHDVLAAADVVLLPSETLYAKMDLPLVLLEAMSLARPVVVLEGTAAAELCAGEAAIAVPEAGEALVERVRALLCDPDLRTAQGARGRERVLSQHSPTRMAAAYEALYDTLG